MTTTIPSTITRRTVSLTHEDEGRVVVRIASTLHAESVVVTVKTSDLLGLIRSELGVLIIDKADLPEPWVDSLGYVTAWAPGKNEREAGTADVDNLRQRAYALLSIALHLEAHPPGVEQQVEALVEILDARRLESETTDEIARRLIATGKVTVKS